MVHDQSSRTHCSARVEAVSLLCKILNKFYSMENAACERAFFFAPASARGFLHYFHTSSICSVLLLIRSLVRAGSISNLANNLSGRL